VTSPAAKSSVVLVGAGKMGQALLQGLCARQDLEAITIIEPNPSQELRDFCHERGLALLPAADATLEAPDALILAIKPQILDAAARSVSTLAGPDTVVISILAGKRIADLLARFPQAKAIVRAMPNTPAAIGRGITGAFANSATSPGQRELAHLLLGAVGGVEWVDEEALIDAVTAVSGSGPAYVFYLAECVAAAGEAAGLPRELSMRLARATIAGAGELMRVNPDVTPDVLRQNVTSPGGTTAAALEVLMAGDGLDSLLARAVAAAKRRAAELSG
jgi:pyrroline-5-carboxylate reductase